MPTWRCSALTFAGSAERARHVLGPREKELLALAAERERRRREEEAEEARQRQARPVGVGIVGGFFLAFSLGSGSLGVCVFLGTCLFGWF